MKHNAALRLMHCGNDTRARLSTFIKVNSLPAQVTAARAYSYCTCMTAARTSNACAIGWTFPPSVISPDC